MQRRPSTRRVQRSFMKRGSSNGAPHAVQIATRCDGQPTLPSLREALGAGAKYRRHVERAGRSGPRCGGCRTWGQAASVAERGNLKAPEVTQLNYRPTTKLHKAKVCDAVCKTSVGFGSKADITPSLRLMFALPPKADIDRRDGHVRLVPTTGLMHCSK